MAIVYDKDASLIRGIETAGSAFAQALNQRRRVETGYFTSWFSICSGPSI